jgi:hypothetical protein
MAAEYVITFEQLEDAIIRLEGRIEIKRLMMENAPAPGEHAAHLRMMHHALHKMRAIRDAILIDEPAGALH